MEEDEGGAGNWRVRSLQPGGRTPGMPNHHPHKPPQLPTPKQQRYLRVLAEQTGTSFTPPKTKAEASQEIERLLARGRDSRADQTRARRQVQADLQTGYGDSVRHQPSETTGYGSSARWAHRDDNAEAGR